MKCALVSTLTLMLTGAVHLVAEPINAPKTDFVHYVDEDRRGRLQVALASYINPKGVQVDLVGAVHVGDASYYQDLNERFKSYDSLLFEMVRSEQEARTSVDSNPSQMGAVQSLQLSMKRILGLEFQLDAINYTANNFVHADLTLEEFLARQAERGETIFSFIMKIMEAQLEEEGLQDGPQLGLLQLIQAFMSADRASALKCLVAKQLDFSEAILGAAEEQGETVILTERNKRVIQVLKEQLTKDHDRLGIFYGAAHCPDLEKRLYTLGFQRIGQTWLTAWDMPK